MAVNTKSVKGRRELRFESLDEMLADARQMASQKVTTLGNWSFGQILKHLAIALDRSIDGAQFRPPFFIRRIAPLFKKQFLTKPLRPGFKMPEKMKPDFAPPNDCSIEEGLKDLEAAVERQKSETHRAPNALLGKLTKEEYEQFNLRHAEMHLSFVVPTTQRA